MSRIGYCVSRSLGHKFRLGEITCVNCEFQRSWVDAQDEADVRDARLEIQRADYEAFDYCSDGERDAMRGRPE